MSAQKYAKIENGLVVNTQVIDPQVDPSLDPAFLWVPIDGVLCGDGSPVEIGCTYDGISFVNSG